MRGIHWSEWLSPDGFLSFYHQSHPDHGVKVFSDTINNTCINLMGAFLCQEINRVELKKILSDGLHTRTQNPDEMLERYPGARDRVEPGYRGTGYRDKKVNKDQLTFLIPLLREVGMGKFADKLIKEYGGWMMPHQTDSFYNKSTWLGRIFQYGDAVIDGMSGNVSSQLNTLGRLAWSDYKGMGNKKATLKYRENVDPWYALVVFGSRTPNTGSGKDKKTLKIIYDNLFENVVACGANVNSPSPIYQPWPLV